MGERLHPNVVFSIGWTTKYDESGQAYYTRDMMDEMIALVKNHIGDMSYTICLRAIYVRRSIDNIKYLIEKLPNYHFTIWKHGAKEILSDDELQWIEANIDPTRTMYDLNDPVITT